MVGKDSRRERGAGRTLEQLPCPYGIACLLWIFWLAFVVELS